MLEIPISQKEKMMRNVNYNNQNSFPYKINMEVLQENIMQECYRNQLVSYYQLAPLTEVQVPISEADFILYANPFASVEDFSESVLKDIKYLDKIRKKDAEIIIMGRAVNIKNMIEGLVNNVTYVPSHYAEYIGKRFGFDIKEEYVVFDDELNQLNIWPVDGCNNQCGFCRRTYMNIPFESQPLEKIKELLDYWQENHPKQMKIVSLRAENLTEYGIDIYGKQMLHKVIELLERYQEIEYINMPIGMNIGEITDEILEALIKCKKIYKIALNLEAGSDRLLNIIGKKHTCERAKYICKKLVESNPHLYIDSTIMVGLPTEGLEDMLMLANLVEECRITYLHCNYYRYNPKHPIAKYEQLNEKVRELHLKYLIRLLKKNHCPYYLMEVRHESFLNPSKRSDAKKIEYLKNEQKYSLHKVLDLTYENLVGFDVSVKSKEYYKYRKDLVGLYNEARKIKRIKKICN